MVTTEVEPDDAGRYGVVRLDGERVTEYVYKPDEPATSTISNEVFVFSPGEVLDRLDALAEESGELEDLGDALLPGLVEDGRARAHRFDGYWRDVGTIDAFHSAHMEQLEHPPPIDLDDPAWPVLTHAAARRASTRVLAGARVEQSMLATAATIGGTVEHSVIGRGAVIEEGAVVRDSVVLPGAVVRSGATVERAILDDLVQIGRGVPSAPPAARSRWWACARGRGRPPRGGAVPGDRGVVEGAELRLGGEVRVPPVPSIRAARKSTVRKLAASALRTSRVPRTGRKSCRPALPPPPRPDVSPAGLVPEVPAPLALELALGA